MVFGSDPAQRYGRGNDAEGLLFAQDAAPSGRFAPQWGDRDMAQEPALTEMANSKLRRLSAQNEIVQRRGCESGGYRNFL